MKWWSRWMAGSQKPRTLDISGIPLAQCVCGGDVFRALVRFSGDEIVWYTTTAYCQSCDARVTLKTEADA